MGFLGFIRPRAGEFARDERGNVAMMFGICILAILTVVGGAIDLRRAEVTKQFLQSSLDSAVVAAARSHAANPGMSIEEAKNVASAFFTENVQTSDYGYQLNSFNLTYSEESGTYMGSVKGMLPTTMLSIAGISKTDLNVDTEVTISPPDNLEVMMVLDNTTSMEGQKLADLKDSANQLVDTLLKDDPENVKIGVIPFSNYVNVGLSVRNEFWMDVQSDYSETKNFCYNTYPNATPTGEFETVERTESYDCKEIQYSCKKDGMKATCTKTQCKTRTISEQQEIIDQGDPVEVCSSYTNEYKWNGCVGSRKYPFNKRDEQYKAKRIPGLLNQNCTAEILPLTNQRSVVKDKLNSLFTQGDTYSPAGLMWGLRALSPEAPLEDAMPFSSGSDALGIKAMVFMTDGVNSLSQDGKTHNGKDRKKADKLSFEICDEIKTKNIRLFTIAFELPDTDAKSLLEKCASDAGSYFDAGDKAALDKAFADISANLIELHISK